MIDQKPICNDQQLLQMLRSRSDSNDSPEMLDHVENCERCQLRLDELAAAESEWQRTVEVLSSRAHGEASEERAGFGSPDNLRGIHLRQPGWTESMARQLLSPPSHPEMLGRIGRYDVERLIGSGGMGVVFKAYDTELNRPVAVKLLAPYLAENGSARKRFAREARAAAAVVDDHVVPIHNVETGESGSEPPFLVMKYIAGGSLQQRLDRDGPLDVCEILRIGMQTAKGLAAAHAQGLIHRDVKPSNILLDEGVDRALLTDFGLARAEDDACLTRSGFHPGTPHYMSPEQVRGEAIDGRSDLFSLGCVLYALCTGHPPFRAETSYAVLRRITDDTARPIRELHPNIPEWLERIVIKLLSKSRDDRFDSAEQVAELLEDCLAHVQHPTTTRLPFMPEPTGLAAGSPELSLPEASAFGSRSRLIQCLIATAAFPFVIFAGILIVLESTKGTLTIESETDDVPIRIMQGDDVVQKLTVTKGAKSVRIASGIYAVEIDGEFEGLMIEEGIVSLIRNTTTVVKIISRNESEIGDRPVEINRLLNLPDDTQVHVVGCYMPASQQPINVEVNSTGKPMVVILNSYRAASWNLHVNGDADVRGVILSGYFDQRFSHSGPRQDVQTIVSTYFPVWDGITQTEKDHRMDNCFYAWSALDDVGFAGMQAVVSRMTDRQLTTFQGNYTGTLFLIDGQRGTEDLAIAKRWQAFAQNSDKSSIKFHRIEAQLNSLRDNDRSPFPVRLLAEKMDELGVSQLAKERSETDVVPNRSPDSPDAESKTFFDSDRSALEAGESIVDLKSFEETIAQLLLEVNPKNLTPPYRLVLTDIEYTGREEVGDFKEVVREKIAIEIGKFAHFELLSRRFAVAAMAESRLKVKDLFYLDGTQKLFAGMEKLGQPADYLLSLGLRSVGSQTEFHLAFRLMDKERVLINDHVMVSRGRLTESIQAMKQQVQGSWIVESLSAESKDGLADVTGPLELLIDGDVLTIPQLANHPFDMQWYGLSAKNKDDRTIYAVNFVVDPNGEKVVAPGIIASDGDRLRICWGTSNFDSLMNDAVRPDRFLVGSKVWLFECRRKPLGAEKISEEPD